ncbi:MAG: SurA N-terminal domain-containing protein [Anaerolineae bacterium]
MAKQKQSKKQLTRRQIARREREHRAQRLITWIAVGVGVVILGLLIYGVVTEVFIEARRPVARVGDEPITTREFEARQGYERWMSQLEIYQYQSYLSQLSTQVTPETEGPQDEDAAAADQGTDALIQQLEIQLSSLERQLSPDYATVYGGQVLDRMIEEELIRQEAAERGMTVSDEEVQEQIGLLLGYNPDAAANVTETTTITDTLTATATPDFDDLFEQFETNVLEVTRFPEEDFRAMVRAEILREEIKSELASDIPEVQDQVEITIFAFGTEEAAQAVTDRLNEEDADPEAILDELEADEDDATSGFALPWLPMGYLGAQLSVDVETAAFNTPVGQASSPVAGENDRYYVVYVTGHEERALTEDLLAQAEDQAYEGWLTQAKEERVEYLDWEDAVVTE